MKYPNFKGDEPCTSLGLVWYYDEELNPSLRHVRVAVSMCNACPMVHECRDWGVRHERYGIWGGMTPADRKRERQRLGLHLEPLEVTALVS